ncbi:hypothetical protein V565_121010 [Rhizoctonia solani 123E]|uniref:Uncharacterized protein n=1 Tax=Rhizoctonia solani 123E TaxID=1423351 RepID=A0A074RNB6_9AGAM|nr:hypothetical protein V565_121010 [Rhizoctonia solani 123E]
MIWVYSLWMALYSRYMLRKYLVHVQRLFPHQSRELTPRISKIYCQEYRSQVIAILSRSPVSLQSNSEITFLQLRAGQAMLDTRPLWQDTVNTGVVPDCKRSTLSTSILPPFPAFLAWPKLKNGQ